DTCGPQLSVRSRGGQSSERRGPAARISARWAARGEPRGASRSDADSCRACKFRPAPPWLTSRYGVPIIGDLCVGTGGAVLDRRALAILFLTLFLLMLGVGIIIPNIVYHAETSRAT